MDASLLLLIFPTSFSIFLWFSPTPRNLMKARQLLYFFLVISSSINSLILYYSIFTILVRPYFWGWRSRSMVTGFRGEYSSNYFDSNQNFFRVFIWVWMKVLQWWLWRSLDKLWGNFLDILHLLTFSIFWRDHGPAILNDWNVELRIFLFDFLPC